MIVIFSLLVIACGEKSTEADVKQSDATKKLMQEANSQIGLPNITNFQMKKTMKMIMEETDKENSCSRAWPQAKMD